MFHFPIHVYFNILVEWWVHLRPHSNGHQLHFDSDETAIEHGQQPRHPIVSSVLFVSDDAIGGPTLVTNQVYKIYAKNRLFFLLP